MASATLTIALVSAMSASLKKLRACHTRERKFRTRYLWRGMKNRQARPGLSALPTPRPCRTS